MNLRKFTWSLKFLKPPDTYKIEIITQIINAYPSRKYICVGDSGMLSANLINTFCFFSGEIDPEVYSKLYTLFPQNIAHIFIRDICHLPECLPTCAERYTKAFENVPIERWTIFRNPNEIHPNIETFIAE